MRVIFGSRRYRAKALLALVVVLVIGAALLVAGSIAQRALGALLIAGALALAMAARTALSRTE